LFSAVFIPVVIPQQHTSPLSLFGDTQFIENKQFNIPAALLSLADDRLNLSSGHYRASGGS
jgi:hypothetical protein